MQNIVWKVVLILVILAVCFWSVWPPEDKIRLGKDLQGGTSLIYLVNMPADTPEKQRVLAQVIEVLKERVNPQGVLDISMQPLGVDRIEIVMPLPNEEVKALRVRYDVALKELLRMAEIREADLDEALRFNQAAELVGETERATQFENLQKAYNDLQAAEKALNEAVASGIPAEELRGFQWKVASAKEEYEKQRDAVLRTSLDQARVTRTLALPTEREVKKNALGEVEKDETGKEMLQESPREVAVTAIKQDFPHLAAVLDKTIVAYDEYRAKRTTLDDPEDLMRLLRGAGVLEFHIAVNNSSSEGVSIQEMREQLAEVGPENTTSIVAAWYPLNELKQWYRTPEELQLLESDPESFFANNRDLVAARYGGDYFLLLYKTPGKSMTHTPETPWSVESTGLSTDDLGRPAVSFNLNPSGGNLMGRLTGANTKKPMAIVLDGQVYSAPTIDERIGNRGIIRGEFSQAELDYLTRVLAAGSLEARLSDEPIAINTLGPSLGKDNLYRGLRACVLSLIITASIMLGYYFWAGLIANVALLANALMIFGVMALIDGTFTLPGLAGIALSVAMAVDANVLIYERVREEIVNNKEDLRTAIRLGYRRALSAIIDGNLTNLIVGVVLYYTATTEVKGFALTMMLGVVATLFSSLFITRVLYAFYTDAFKWRALPMLPIVFPGITRALTPSVNWISKRGIFLTASAVVAVLSLGLVVMRGPQMLDTEFRGGLAMTMQTRLANPDEPGYGQGEGRLLLARPEVEARIHKVGDDAGPQQPVVHQLASATVLTVGEMDPQFRASRFQVKVGNPPGTASDQTIVDTVQDAVVGELGSQLDIIPDLSFKGAGETRGAAYTFPIDQDTLGANIARPEHTQSVARYRGGVAIVLDDITPAVSLDAERSDSAQRRILRLREQPDFSAARGRDFEVIGLEPVDPTNPAKGFTSVVVLVYDKNLDKRRVDIEAWLSQLAESEWNLVSTAMAKGSSLQEIASFSPAVAKTLAANATVAVVLSLLGMLLYIWVRFGSLRYSFCTVIALAFNVIVCLGALALTHYLAGTKFASWILLEEFRIDLNVIAALLTIIGYSLNDTIVILDRIRENRGKRLFASPEIVNTSINQTFSRTILTGGSTILAAIILYVQGGTALQPFAFTFLIGLVVGTFSSVAIAAPLVTQPPVAPSPELAAQPARGRGETGHGTAVPA